MDLKGGVIIIGSLIWDPDLKKGDGLRKKWRKQNLKAHRKRTPVPIRYGRESTKNRKGTYSMIFTKGCETSLGQGLILEFKEEINSFENLEKQAIALADAEGIYTPSKPRLTCDWGSVGLLINPGLEKSDLENFKFITKKWTELYHSYQNTFNSVEYMCDEDDNPPIDQNGFLTISWQKAMNDFDILIATPVVPDPKRLLKPKEIADKMIEKDYTKYFRKNIANKIKTVQDAKILRCLEKA